MAVIKDVTILPSRMGVAGVLLNKSVLIICGKIGGAVTVFDQIIFHCNVDSGFRENFKKDISENTKFDFNWFFNLITLPQ